MKVEIRDVLSFHLIAENKAESAILDFMMIQPSVEKELKILNSSFSDGATQLVIIGFTEKRKINE